MTPQYILGLDSGTSVVKSVVFDLDGQEISVARRDMTPATGDSGRSEVDMEALWQLAGSSTAEAVASVGGEAIAAVGLCGTCSGVWPIDDTGRPTRRAILWNDARANDFVVAWQESGLYRQIFDVSGCAPLSGYPLPSLAWLQRYEPEVLKKTRWLLFHKDWLRYKLTGEVHVEESDVSYTPGDAWARTYSNKLFKACGLDACLERLPTVVSSLDVVGEITPQAARMTGLRAGTPVVAGAVDVVASTLGAGAFRPGQACSILGTSFLNSIVLEQPIFTPRDSGAQACMPNETWLRSIINTSGTLSTDWLADTLAGPEQASAKGEGRSVFEIIEEGLSEVPDGSNGVIFLPYLNTSGINSPFPEPAARAVFFGLSAQTTRRDLMRAVYEGAVLSMRDCYDAMEQAVEEILLVGGGARSSFWAQLCADATGHRIVTTEGEETGARGVAMLAAVGCGIFPSIEAAVQAMVRPAQVFMPRPVQSQVYDHLYELYRTLYTAVRGSWRIRERALAKVEGLLRKA